MKQRHEREDAVEDLSSKIMGSQDFCERGREEDRDQTIKKEERRREDGSGSGKKEEREKESETLD